MARCELNVDELQRTISVQMVLGFVTRGGPKSLSFKYGIEQYRILLVALCP